MSGLYLFNIPTNSPENEVTNTNIEYPEKSFVDPFNSQVVQDLLSNDFLKTDPLLTNWINTGEEPAHILKIGSKSSILLLTKNDPTLDQTISPIGSFKFGDFDLYWVHTLVDSPKDIIKLSENDNVIRIIADNSNIEETDDPYGNSIVVDQRIESYNPLTGPGSNPKIDTQNLNTREILGANYVEDTFGYNGTGSVVNVHDTGIDFGHTALIGTMALDSEGRSTTFDGTGSALAITNMWSEQYYRDQGDDVTADIFKPLHSNNVNQIDLSGYDKLKVWSVNNFKTVEMKDDLNIPLPKSYDVAGIPGNDSIDGYRFGIVAYYNSIFWNLVPFLSVDTNNDGDYDTLYFDWETAYYMSGIRLGIIPVDEYLSRSPFSFSESSAYTDLDNPYLSADFTGEEDLGTAELNTPDGYIDMSLGVLGNVFDNRNVTGRLGNGDPLVRGIESSGIGFGFFYDYAAHGTGVTGTIAAQDISYQIQQNSTLYSIRGAAPGAKIIGTLGLISDSADVYSMLWISGYEPDTSFEWNFVNDHIANISSNSWGFPQFSDLVGINDDLVGGYDFYSLFFELLSPPGYLSPEHPGMIFVVSAGNSGPGYGTGGSPVNPSLILVGASTSSWWRENIDAKNPWSPNQPSDQIIAFSSTGPSLYNYPKVDIVATGAFDYSALPSIPFIYTQGDKRFTGGNGTFQLFSGTSEAAPFTSAVLAVQLEAWKDEEKSTIAPDQAKVILKSSAVDLGYDVYRQGAGRASITRGVHLILNGSLPGGEELFMVNSTDAYETAAERISVAFEFWFDGAFRLNATNVLPNSNSLIKHPSSSVSISDTAIYGSIISPGESYSASLDLDKDAANATAYKFEAFYNASSISFTSQNEYNYHFLDDIFNLTALQEADMIQFSISIEDDGFLNAFNAGSWYEVSIGKHFDNNNDNIVDNNERTLDTFGFNENSIITFFANSKVAKLNSMLMVRDQSFDAEYSGPEFETSSYNLNVRAYKRVQDDSIIIGDPISNNYQITIDPDNNASPGFYQGFIKFVGTNGGYVLAQYAYSVPLQIDNFDDGGWSEVSGLTNRPFDNGVFGAIDWGWRASSGDWRIYDIEFTGTVSTANTLAIELEWTYNETAIDVNVFDFDGVHIASSDIIFEGNGRYNSSANAPPNKQRLLVNITDYRLGNTQSGENLAGNNSIFTVALHATAVDSKSGTLDPISLRAAWLTATMDSLGKPEATLITSDGTSLADGMPLTHGKIGLTWSNVSVPAIGFTNINVPREYKVSKADFYLFEDVIDAEDLIAFSDEENVDVTYEIYFEKGMEISIDLSWPQFSTDFDLIIVPKGKPLTGSNSIISGTGTGANPETGTTIVPSSGYYIVVVDYFQGDGSAQPFTLEIIARVVAFSTAQTLDSSFEINLTETNFIEGNYLLESSSKGWNENFRYSQPFRFDAYAPQLNFSETIPELVTSGQVSIGTVYDASVYNFTLSHNGDILVSLTNVNGTQFVTIDAALVPGFFQDTEFTVTGIDQFGHEMSQTYSVYRTDNTQPIFLLEPDNQESLINTPFTLSWLIDDLSSGTYNLKIAGISTINGSWTKNIQLDIELSFDTTGSKFISLEIVDRGGNTHRSFVRISIVNELTTNTDVTSSSTNTTTDTGLFDDLPSDAGTKLFIPLLIGVIIISAAAAGGTIYMRRRPPKTPPTS
ncbi:MAG: S8 family serine peptidase [Candidatus Heimdallarchaeota archaeon]|nr:S8 family serine peptidase [Candidatus Heimdallarchaeota archaeon]